MKGCKPDILLMKRKENTKSSESKESLDYELTEDEVLIMQKVLDQLVEIKMELGKEREVGYIRNKPLGIIEQSRSEPLSNVARDLNEDYRIERDRTLNDFLTSDHPTPILDFAKEHTGVNKVRDALIVMNEVEKVIASKRVKADGNL